MKDKVCVERLENLKQVTILDYLNEIDFDNKKSLYDVMMKHFFEGELDDVFIFSYLSNLEEKEKREIFELARKYQALCFYLGDFSYWADSIGGVYLSDYEFVSQKLLDHYDFLLGLIYDGGEQVLKMLMHFVETMSKKGSVLDFLRNSFVNDEILKEIIIEMSREDGIYQRFSIEEKEVLCRYPEGVLYLENKDSIEKVSVEEIQNKIQQEFDKTKDITFEEAVSSISYHYLKKNRK